jgi:hypothetical protein
MREIQEFVLVRLHTGAWALGVILIILLLQDRLSDSIAVHEVTPRMVDEFVADQMQLRIWEVIKLFVFIPALIFWLLDRRKELRTAILVSNILLTFELTSSVILLALSLTTTVEQNVVPLIRDTIIVMGINILTFSLWYWWMDVPNLRERTGRENDPWDFLFPQRATTVPGYANWRPWYPDYLFLAIITTTAFGPADTLPLSWRAKLLMGLQVVLAFTILTVLAGRALSIVGS